MPLVAQSSSGNHQTRFHELTVISSPGSSRRETVALVDDMEQPATAKTITLDPGIAGSGPDGGARDRGAADARDRVAPGVGTSQGLSQQRPDGTFARAARRHPRTLRRPRSGRERDPGLAICGAAIAAAEVSSDPHGYLSASSSRRTSLGTHPQDGSRRIAGFRWLSGCPLVEMPGRGSQPSDVGWAASFPADEVVVVAVCERDVDSATGAAQRVTHGTGDPGDLE